MLSEEVQKHRMMRKKIEMRRKKSMNRLKLQNYQATIVLVLIAIATQTIVSSQKSEFKEPQAESVASAMIDVIRKFYIANNIDFDFIIYGQTSRHIDDVLLLVIKELSKEITVNVRHIMDINGWNHELGKSAVFLIKEVGDFYQLNELSIRKGKTR
jgi:hypothetical protein